MNKSNINEQSAGTEADRNSTAQNLHVSQPNANTNVSSRAFMVLRGKEHGNIFWTTGGKYRDDWYELLFESDDEEAVKEHWRLKFYGRHGC